MVALVNKNSNYKGRHKACPYIALHNAYIYYLMNSSKKYNRKSIRLKGYDYSQEALYFITLVCQSREYLFGEIKNDKPILNDAGKMIKNQLFALQKQFSAVQIHEYVIMPNHSHIILQIVEVKNNDPVKTILRFPLRFPQRIYSTKNSIGSIIGAYKSITTNKYINGIKNKNWKPFEDHLWQRNYWEHIIRNEKSLDHISQYIINNPKNWISDKFYKNKN